MDKTLMFAAIAITLALLFYTIGVWGQIKARNLKKWHVAALWIGLLCDLSGTLAMTQVAGSGTVDVSAQSSLIHSMTGILGIALMLINTIWATITIKRNVEIEKKAFQRISLSIWLIWLVPYFIGMFIGMSK